MCAGISLVPVPPKEQPLAALLALEETSVAVATFLGQTPLLGRLLCTKCFDFLLAIS